MAARDRYHHRAKNEPIAKLLVDDYNIQIVVFEPEQEVILKWIP